MSALSAVRLAETRAALAAGATPSAALLAGFTGDEALEPVVRAVRVGTPLHDLAARLDTGDSAADLLVRALAVAEATGAGAAAAVDQALAAAGDEASVARLLRSRTAQARGTALMLAGLPVLGWAGAVLAGADLRFLRTPFGATVTGVALLLGVLGGLWSRRLVRHVAAAAASADPLHPRPPRDWGRGSAVGLPAAVLVLLLAGPVPACVVGGLLVAVLSRRPAPAAPGAAGAAETVELVAVALAAGLAPASALAAVAPLAPPVARAPLVVAARRLRSGWTPGEALAGSGLQALGEVLDATQRWGAPAGGALADLAADLRARRRAAAEEAAERTQLLLVFPTTLLTLPSFLLAVVPPLLWGAFAG